MIYDHTLTAALVILGAVYGYGLILVALSGYVLGGMRK